MAELPGDAGPVFEFPLASANTGPDGALVLRFTGPLQFQAHHGMLNVAISSPSVTFKDGVANISVRDAFAGEPGHPVRIARFEYEVHVAVDGRISGGSSEVLLTLGDVYPARTWLEPLAFDVHVQGAPQ